MTIEPTSTDANAPATPGRAWGGIPLLLWALVVLTLIILPLRILDHGFLPPDDALRHAAKVVSGKSWPEILVLRPEITMDHNPGWHWLLGSIHHATGWDPPKLVAFSVVSMFLLFTVAPLPWLKRPEAWLVALAVVLLVFPYFEPRAFVGRPLFVTMAVNLVLLSVWTRPELKTISPAMMLGSTALMAVATWVHGSWYLLVLVPGVFCLAQAWRKAGALAICWAVGSVAGAMLTGEPWNFLRQELLIPLMALGQNAPVESLVGEFQPFSGGYPAAVIVALVMVWRKLTKRPGLAPWRDPVFLMALAGWLLGFRVLRFWLDWGLPALALWLAREFQDLTAPWLPANSSRRAAVGGLAALVLLLVAGGNRGNKWSQYGAFQALDSRNPAHAGWVPDRGGIFYCVDLTVFYENFFRNPHGDWRYVLGFEPSFMRPEDLAVYQELWRSGNAITATAPWIQRMTPADRLVLRGGEKPRPAFGGLEWAYPVEGLWVGRRPGRK